MSRARPTPLPSPSAERQYPSCDTPSYDPGFRVSRAAPGGERPRLTQTQNRSPFVALLATSPPRNPLSLSSLSLPPPRRLVTLVTISQLCLGGGKEKRRDRGRIEVVVWRRLREKLSTTFPDVVFPFLVCTRFGFRGINFLEILGLEDGLFL